MSFTPTGGSIPLGHTVAWKNLTNERAIIKGGRNLCGGGNPLLSVEPGQTSLPYKPGQTGTWIFDTGAGTCGGTCGSFVVTEL